LANRGVQKHYRGVQIVKLQRNNTKGKYMDLRNGEQVGYTHGFMGQEWIMGQRTTYFFFSFSQPFPTTPQSLSYFFTHVLNNNT
jgi:hypothetical protein